MATLILSDGTRSIDFLSASGFKVPQDGINLPVVSREDTFAEGSDSEGRSRVRSRATNSTAGQISLYLSGATASALWTTIDNLQELVESAHLNKGSISYLGPGASSTVTYDLESISLTDLPQVGIELTQLRCNATITFESKPYGRLPTQRLNVQDSYQAMVTALSPSIFLPLGASSGLTDLSGNGRNGTAVGGLTVGGYSPGPLAVGDEGATNFDGTDDRVSTTYATRQNLVTNPRGGALATTGWSTSAGVVNAGATITAVNDWRTTAFNVSTTGAAVEQGAYIPFNLTSGTSVQARIRLKRTAGTGTIYARVVRNSSPWTTHVIVAASTQTEFSELTLDFTPNFTGEWVLIVGVNEASATTFRFTECLVGTAGTYFDGAGFENPEGFYQPSIGQSGWRGTAHASISDLGCFANGTTRTFMGWAYRDTSSGVDTIFSGSGATPPVLAFSSGSQNIVWKPDNSTTTTWASGISNGTWFHWELEFAEPTASNNASLYINGALISAQTNAGQYSANCGNFQLGALTSTTDPFDGKQAWTSVHQTALTATQIRDCYDAGKAQITLDGPIDSFVVSGVPGQVPALPVITLDDASTQARNIVEVGVQNSCDPSNLEPVLLQSIVDMSVLAGSSNTRAGSHSTNIIRAALGPQAVAVCYAGSQRHDGPWKVRARIYPSASTVLVRLAWRIGDGPFSKEKWVAVPGSAAWFDLDLGTVNLGTYVTGQNREFRVEAKATSGVPTVDVDILELIPADSYMKLRGSNVADTSSGSIIAVDDFSTQTAGAVTGKTPLLVPSGTYAAVGDADDFNVDTTNQCITRTAVSDSSVSNGRYLRCGSANLIMTMASLDLKCEWMPDRFGLMLRHDGTTANCLFAVLETTTIGTAYSSTAYLAIIKRVASVETYLAYAGPITINLNTWHTITASVDSTGYTLANVGVRGASSTLTWAGVSSDSSLATAGALATGGYGIYDATTASNANTRSFDNFAISTLSSTASIVSPVVNSGYGVDVKHNTALTDNSAGTSVGTTPIRQGNYPKLPPATRNTSKSRIVVRARRNDNDLGLADTGTSDALRASLTVTPRVHLTGT